jgi:hypothetical protein
MSERQLILLALLAAMAIASCVTICARGGRQLDD